MWLLLIFIHETGIYRLLISLFPLCFAVVIIQIDLPLTCTIFEGESIDVCVSKNLASTRPVNFSLTSMDGNAGGILMWTAQVCAHLLAQSVVKDSTLHAINVQRRHTHYIEL